MLYIVYALVGILLAVPYCFLAGWSTKHLMIVAFVAPPFLGIWFLIGCLAGIFEPSHGKRRIRINWRAVFQKGGHERTPVYRRIFWIWTLYSLTPIILHWSAVLLGRIGYEKAGSAINNHRYESPYYMFVAVLLLLIVLAAIGGAWEAIKNRSSRVSGQ